MKSYHASLASERQLNAEVLQEILADAKRRIRASISSKEEKFKGDNFTMPNIIDSVFSNLTVPPDTSITRGILVAAFRELFKGHAGLVASKEPFITAFLKSGAIKFPSPELAIEAYGKIPLALKNLKDKKSNEEELTKALGNILRKPEITFLFGSGAVNTSRVEAFKTELYHSFKHRLAEAVKAEREADYDYWWLTFFPKGYPAWRQLA